MLKIRLQRTGRKHEPTFRVVLTESTNGPKSGRFLEVLGSYDPREKTETALKADRINHWISKGAKPSDTLHNLLIEKGVIKGEKINVLPKKAPIKKEGEEAPQVEATPVSEEAKADTPAEEVQTENPVEESPAEEVKEEVKEETSAPEEKTEEAPVEEPKEEEKPAE